MAQSSTETQETMSAAEAVAEQTLVRQRLLAGGYVPLANVEISRIGNRRFLVLGKLAYVETTKGVFTAIDADDLDFVLSFCWHASTRKTKTYVARNPLKSRGESTRVYLHRALMRPQPGMVVDHIDGNPLNNMRSNLRCVTQMQNTWNSQKHVDNTSGFKGVYRYGMCGRWEAKIRIAGKTSRIGVFDSKEQAAAAYAEYAVREQGALRHASTQDALKGLNQ